MNSWSNGVSSARASRLSTALPEAQPGPAAAAALCVLSRGRRARGEGAARPAHVAASRPARLTCLVEAAQLVESTSGPGRVTRPIGARPASTPGTRGTAGHPAQPVSQVSQWESALHGQAGSGPASSRPTASGSPAGRQHQVARDHHSQMSIRWPVSTIRISVGRQLIFYLLLWNVIFIQQCYWLSIDKHQLFNFPLQQSGNHDLHILACCSASTILIVVFL